MPWLRLESTFARHRKIRRLAEILNIKIYEARGLVAGLLCKVCAEQPDGVLDEWNAGDIAWACDWDGNAQALYDGLLHVRLIIKTEHHTEINDWMLYAAGYREAERARKYRERKKNNLNDGAKRVTDPNVTHHVRVPDPLVTRHADRTGPDQIHIRDSATKLELVNEAKSNNRTAVDASVDVVWQHYREHHPKASRVLKPGRKEYRLIKQRLEDFEIEDLKQAIDNYHRSPFHNGQNDRGKRYLSLELMMRDISHVQAGLELGDPSTNGGRPKRMLDTQLANDDTT